MDREEVDCKPQAGKEIEGFGERKKSSREFYNGLIMGVLAMTLLFAGVYAGKTAYQKLKVSDANPEIFEDGGSVVSTEAIQKIKTIEAAIDASYYYDDQVSEEDLREGIYKGMVTALGDPYSESVSYTHLRAHET